MICIDHISEPVYLDYQIKQAIEAINEFLKDLWHDAKEEPYSNLSPILFDGRDREDRQIVKTNFFRSSYWNKAVEYYGIVR